MKSITYKFSVIVLTFFVFSINNVLSQNDHEHTSHESQLKQLIPSVPYLVYDSDSLSGFNEPAAMANAIEEGYSQENTERYIYLRKREYIKTKYAINSISNFKTFPPTPQAACTNIDFETGTTAGWTTTGDAVIKSGAGADPFGGFPVVCPGGSFSLQLGNNTNVTTSIARQTFAVTPANAYFVLKFAMVILNYPHSIADAARVFIRFKDGTGAVIACPNLECYYANNSSGVGQSYGLTGFQTGANGVNIGAQSYPTTYIPWTNLGFDLTPYIGQNMTVEIENRWCVYNYDWAYCYVDGLCSTLTTSVTGGCAGATTGTLTAPGGMDNYTWAGPAGSSVSSITTQTATTNVSGIYTVTCVPYSSCGGASYVYTLNFAPTLAPTANFNYTVAPCASSFNVPVLDNSLTNGGGPITGYTWDWGDATPFGSGSSTSHIFASAGTQTVELKVTNGSCTDSITKTFVFNPGPTSNFNTSSACLNTVTNFTSTSTPTLGLASHVWDFGDGTAAGSGSNPSHTYTSPGIKTITYTVTNTSGCTSIITKTLTVYPNPVAAITSNTVCLNVATVFGNTSSVSAPDNISTWAWDFNNDGIVDNGTQTPTNTYAAAGTYTVELKTITNNGCMDSTTIQVKVNALPTATFTPVNACLNTNVVLNNTSTIAAPDNISTYAWNFGVGASPATSAIANPTPLVYTTSGIKNITLNLIANTTCTATITQTVNVFPQPVANFSATSVCQSTATAYTDLSTPTGSITAWAWDYTNDGSIDNATNAPSNVYASSGTYSTSLIVTSSNNCKDTVVLPINVWGHAIPNFSPTNVCFGTASTFSNLTNTTINANVGGTPTWAWNFGDGSAVSGTQDPVHSYTSTVVTAYNVTLTATTTNGCVDNSIKTVTVNVLPTATFTPVNACLNTNVVLNNTSSIPAPDNISTYAWDFGTGSAPSSTSTVQNPLGLTYTSSGIKTITLTITANTTCSATITNTVTIYPQPVANFSTTSVCQSTATAYTDLSTPTGSITAWAWDFTNDGSVDNATNAPTTIYPTSGTFTASLIVTDNNSCKDTVALPLNVWGHAIPNFTATTVCFNLANSFSNTTNTITNANVGGTPTWAWNFGDASAVSATQDPTHTYTSNLVYTYSVTLTATTTNGCVDNIVKTVTVNVLPTATFTPVNACMNANVLLNNTSSIPAPDNISTYAWDFGTGSLPATTSSVQNPPVLTYNSSGVKTITLTITANTSCTATITNTVTIYPQPVANFSTTSVCQATATAFTDLSTPTGSITAWDWDFTNNGSTDNATSAPTNVYSTSGTFTVSLIVTDIHTCKDTVKLSVDVWGHTIPDFTPDKVCFGTSSVFTNLTDETTNANVGLGSTYVWDFADTSPTTNLNAPSHTYTLGGNANATYNVTLTATSLHNCIDYIIKPVSVYAVPTASFTSDSVCLGSPSHLTDVSNGNGNAVNVYIWDYLSDGTVDVSGVANPNFVFPAFGNNNVTYTVSTSPVAGLVCSNTTNTIQVWVNPNPIPDFTFINKCINAQANTFNGSPSTIAIGTNTAYVWAYGDGAVSTPTTASASTHTYAAAGLYNTTLTLTSNKGCQTSITKQVEVYQKPFMLIANSAACDQVAMTFSAATQANSGTVTNWYWDFNNAISTIEATGQTSGFTFTGPGAHTVALVSETNNLCRDTIRKTVYVNYVPVPLFIVDKASGCPKHCVNFTDQTTPITTPGQIVQWQWTLGDGTTITNGTNANVSHCYINNSSSQLAQFDVQLVVTTDSGCVNTINKLSYITVYPKPIANYTVNPNPGNVAEPLEYFTNQSQDYTKWWWVFGDNSAKDSVNVDPTHFYSDVTAMTYYSVLLVANQYGCMDTAYVPVEIGPEFTFYIPNAFSPANDDGINDYFNGTGIGIAKYEMWVFDRWGEKIFYTDDILKGWNGKVQGKSAEGKQDVYIWKVKLTDVLGKKHEYIGHVTLLR